MTCRPSNNPRPSAAFTLLEVLLAVVVFAIVLAAIEGVFYGALRLRNKTADAFETSLPLQRALGTLRRDLANVVFPGGTLGGPFQTVEVANTNGTETLSTLNPGRGRQVGPDLYTTTGLINDQEPWGEVVKVAYFLNTPTNRFTALGLDLVRSVTRNLLPVVEEVPEPEWLLGDVDDVVFLYCDGLQWLDSWDPEVTGLTLPTAVKVRVYLARDRHSRTEQLPVDLVVPLTIQAAPAAASTNSTASTEGGTP